MNKFSFKNVIVQFDLPFVLRVVDSISGENIPEGYEDYITVINNLPVMLRFEKQVREHGSVAVALEDKHGLLSYSKTQVWFDKTYFRALGLTNEWESKTYDFIDLSITHVNHFLSLYRVAMNAYWIRPISKDEIMSFSFFIRRWDGTGQDHPGLIGSLGTGKGLGSIISDEIDTDIRRHLNLGLKYDDLLTFNQIVFESHDRREYWASVISAAIYFESSLSRWIRNYYLERGKSDEEIDSIFHHKSSHYRSITNLLKTYLPEITGIDIINDSDEPLTDAFNNWQQKSCSLRNKIAHGEQIQVSREQSIDCLDAVKHFLNLIKPYFNFN